MNCVRILLVHVLYDWCFRAHVEVQGEHWSLAEGVMTSTHRRLMARHRTPYLGMGVALLARPTNLLSPDRGVWSRLRILSRLVLLGVRLAMWGTVAASETGSWAGCLTYDMHSERVVWCDLVT